MQINHKIANIVLEENPRSLMYPSLYCCSSKPIMYIKESEEWSLPDVGTYDFTTYFNSVSIQKWRKYADVDNLYLHLKLKGAPHIVFTTSAQAFSRTSQITALAVESKEATDEFVTYDIELPITSEDVIVSFQIETAGEVIIGDSYYYTKVDSERIRPVELALCTTTFKKEDFVIPNIELIKRDIIESDEPISKHFNMHVVDNGRTLDKDVLEGQHVFIHPNPNAGGSGGFARGMIEAMEQDPPATNVILMDDDVAICPESIKRTYTLLTLLNDEYKDSFISGAMLNFEVGEDQWEDLGFMTDEGRFSPVKPPLRLTLVQDLVYNETFEKPDFCKDRTYAAWWYCCIPVDTIKKEGMPLPVFVRCDDAEYGIRCNPHFITMNGICIWHLSFHARYNAAVERYQTTRNTMIAQATTGMSPESDFMQELNNNLRIELKKFNYINAELLLDGFEDFMKGPDYIGKPVAEECFMRSNRKAEKLLDFDALQSQIDDLGIDLDLSEITPYDVYYQPPRSFFGRVWDFATNNGQRSPIAGNYQGFAVIPAAGWEYPAAKIHKKDTLIAIDTYNKKGVIRRRDSDKYDEVMRRYKKDLKYYHAHEDEIKQSYADAREYLTSVPFWKEYLGIN